MFLTFLQFPRFTDFIVVNIFSFLPLDFAKTNLFVSCNSYLLPNYCDTDDSSPQLLPDAYYFSCAIIIIITSLTIKLSTGRPATVHSVHFTCLSFNRYYVTTMAQTRQQWMLPCFMLYVCERATGNLFCF